MTAVVALTALLMPGVAQGTSADGTSVDQLTISYRRQAVVDAAHYCLQQRTPYVWPSRAEP
jgi:hypothetical protein